VHEIVTGVLLNQTHSVAHERHGKQLLLKVAVLGLEHDQILDDQEELQLGELYVTRRRY